MKNNTILPTSAVDLVRGALMHFGRTRFAIVAVTLVVVGISLGGVDEPRRGDIAEFTETLDLDLPERVVSTEPATPQSQSSPGPRTGLWDEVEVRAGQTLEAIFRQQGFSMALLHDILALNGDTARLTRIRPGEVFGFQRGTDGAFKRMRYPADESSYLVVDSHAGVLSAERVPRQLTTELLEAEGEIESSLFLAGKQAGLSDAMVMKLANIFGWDIDFVLDIRSGDRFYLLYEKIYRDGQFLRDGEVLAATFVNQGERFQAVRYEVGGLADYYAPDGRPMRKAFLRAPLNFSYISSNFNPRRFHPILKRIKAHNGIDYRAPTGTPVYAAGDGRVTRSAYSKYNGHHVFIEHANHIVTKYLHFSRRAVNEGQRVKQGQVIGYVGATGLAQAPHLHYEFLLNGVHRNPRTVALPQAEPLLDTRLASFQARAAPFLSQLSRLEAASLYALRE